MTETNFDEIVDFPMKLINKIIESKECVALLVDKKVNEVTENDCDKALDDYIFDYEYVDNTTNTACSYIWVDIDVNRVQNRQIKDIKIYITIACHKNLMKLDYAKFPGMVGNRRDNLVRYVNNTINDSECLGIGNLFLESIRTRTSVGNFILKELTYSIPTFNIVSKGL